MLYFEVNIDTKNRNFMLLVIMKIAKLRTFKKGKKNTRKARFSKEIYKNRLTQNCICDSMKDALL